MESSVWDMPDHVFKVFITMLALKDADHVVRLNPYGLHKKSGKTQEEVMDALRILSSPDTKRIDRQEYEGRRIQSVEEGWLVLNSEKYCEMVKVEMRRANNRKAQAKWREKNKGRPPSTKKPAVIEGIL